MRATAIELSGLQRLLDIRGDRLAARERDKKLLSLLGMVSRQTALGNESILGCDIGESRGAESQEAGEGKGGPHIGLIRQRIQILEEELKGERECVVELVLVEGVV
jgi:hypothetical protein